MNYFAKKSPFTNLLLFYIIVSFVLRIVLLFHPIAFIATYQDLGYIKEDVLTILSPVKQVKQFKLKHNKNELLKPEYEIHYEETPIAKLRTDLVNETIAYYQTTAWLLKHNKLNLK